MHKYFLLVMLFFLIFVAIIASASLFRKNTYKSSAYAYAPICYDKCIGQDRCGNGPPGDPAYNDPCCNVVQQTGDPLSCPYPQRLYCTEEQCSTIPAGVNRQRCGFSRREWCNLCQENNCPGYNGIPNISPPGVNPTSPPQPTNPPNPTRPPRATSTPRPTSPLPRATSTPIPTQAFEPTSPIEPTITSSAQPQPTSSSIEPSPISHPFPLLDMLNPFNNNQGQSGNQPFKFPQITIPEGLKNVGLGINTQATRGLDFFEWVFEKVTSVDSSLQNYIDERINKIFK